FSRDWSSDVCSSDLARTCSAPAASPSARPASHPWARACSSTASRSAAAAATMASASRRACSTIARARRAAAACSGATDSHSLASSAGMRTASPPAPTGSAAGSGPPGVAITTCAALMTLDNDLVLSASRDDDFARLVQAANRSHDALLRLLYVPQPHRTKVLDFLPQHLGGALGHVLENPLGHRLAGRLERQRPHGHVHFRDDFLNGPVVQLDDVFEDEHAQPDF